MEEAGLLASAEENEKVETSDRNEEKKETMKRKHNRELIGTPWFEKMKRRRGGQSSADGRSKVEWEIVEFTADDEQSNKIDTGKRKINISEDDVEMRGGH